MNEYNIPKAEIVLVGAVGQWISDDIREILIFNIRRYGEMIRNGSLNWAAFNAQCETDHYSGDIVVNTDSILSGKTSPDLKID